MELSILENTFAHAPVLLAETLAQLAPRGDDLEHLLRVGPLLRASQTGERATLRLVDCTLGGAGHAAALVEAIHAALGGRADIVLVGFDRDDAARDAAAVRLSSLRERVGETGFRWEIVPHNFASAAADLGTRCGRGGVDLLLADFGVSSPQLDVAQRGFSFLRPGPLDMRMDPRDSLTARDVLETYEARALGTLFRDYGEEPRARKLAEAVATDRAAGTLPLSNTVEFAAWVARVLGYHGSRVHPATRIFQALRMEVNGELDAIEALLDAVPALLSPGGRAGFISFHSLEDRLVKRRMRAWQAANARPTDDRDQSDLPPWVEPRSWGREVPRGGLTAGEDEARANPRSRSARLRVFRFEGASRGEGLEEVAP
jgi:16S rRNA (cytosine1402-N4)-methyltransferase